jgi:hypothetical protein
VDIAFLEWKNSVQIVERKEFNTGKSVSIFQILIRGI